MENIQNREFYTKHNSNSYDIVLIKDDFYKKEFEINEYIKNTKVKRDYYQIIDKIYETDKIIYILKKYIYPYTKIQQNDED